MYWVETWILGGADPKARRPCVVVRAPVSDSDIVMVITRTSDTDARGVSHPRDPSLGLTEPGVFEGRRLHSAEMRQFKPPFAEHAGTLPEPYFSRVVNLYEEG